MIRSIGFNPQPLTVPKLLGAFNPDSIREREREREIERRAMEVVNDNL
jgi:hypothetical protein